MGWSSVNNNNFYQNLMGYQQAGNIALGMPTGVNPAAPTGSAGPTGINPWAGQGVDSFTPTALPTGINAVPDIQALMNNPYAYLPEESKLLFSNINQKVGGVLSGMGEFINGIVSNPANLNSNSVKASNEDVGGNSDSSTKGANVSGPDVNAGDRDAAIKFFEDKGWTRAQAAGIVANLIHESGLKPHGPSGDQGTARGVAQWRGGRQTKFKEIIGKDISKATLKEQLAFVDWELRNTHKVAGDKLRNAATAYNAAGAVCRYYEVPSDIPAKSDARGKLASQIA